MTAKCIRGWAGAIDVCVVTPTEWKQVLFCSSLIIYSLVFQSLRSRTRFTSRAMLELNAISLHVRRGCWWRPLVDFCLLISASKFHLSRFLPITFVFVKWIRHRSGNPLTATCLDTSPALHILQTVLVYSRNGLAFIEKAGHKEQTVKYANCRSVS